MQQDLKQTLVIDNRPGANGNIGATEAARAPSDGYTWLWSTDTLLTVNPHVYAKMAFGTGDFLPVMRASAFSQTLVCHPKAGLRGVADLVGRAKTSRVTYASGGAGSPGHLTTEMFSAAAGIAMSHVPYKGPAPAMQDVMGGQVDCGFLAGPTVLPHVGSGRLTALAVSGARRSPLLPEVPTVAESGYPRFDASFSLVLYAPRATPPAIVQRMHDVLSAALKSPEIGERLAQTDQTVIADTLHDTRARLKQDAQRWGEVARRIHLRLD
jgi:tripartite-type tricarboxylate transporter receptor subunit TctC